MEEGITKTQEKLYESITQKLKQQNVKLTQVRKAIIKILIHLDHPTAPMIVDELKKDDHLINVASVYNTLNVLLDYHVVSANTFNGKQICYEIVAPNLIHFSCIKCNQLYHVDATTFEQLADNQLVSLGASINFLMDHFKIECHGVCENCAINQETGQ